MPDQPEHADPRAPSTAPARLVELADLLGGESTRSRKFLGGLVIGALVGAAVAGTAALARRTRGPADPGLTPGGGVATEVQAACRPGVAPSQASEAARS